MYTHTGIYSWKADFSLVCNNKIKDSVVIKEKKIGLDVFTHKAFQNIEWKQATCKLAYMVWSHKCFKVILLHVSQCKINFLEGYTKNWEEGLKFGERDSLHFILPCNVWIFAIWIYYLYLKIPL